MNQEIVFNDGDSYFKDLLDSISKAKTCIYIETYIFELDEFGKKFMQSLTNASLRGVLVKLLIDGAGCSEWDYDTAKEFRNHNLEIQFFHPLYWQRKKYRLFRYLNPKKLVHGWSLLNHRNHRKVALIDHEFAFVGSFNITSKHLSSLSGLTAWRDSGVKIKDERCKHLEESFIEAWKNHQHYQRRSLKTRVSRYIPFLSLNRSLLERRKTHDAFLQRLMCAKKRILITNPYFIPSFNLRKILGKAVKNKVKVIAILPAQCDFFGVQYAMEGLYSSLLKSGVEIYQYQPSLIHAKVLVTDDQITIGSSNLNSRSLVFDLEVDVEILYPENKTMILNQFQLDLEKSKKLTIHEWEQRSLIQKFMERIFSIFRWVL